MITRMNVSKTLTKLYYQNVNVILIAEITIQSKS